MFHLIMILNPFETGFNIIFYAKSAFVFEELDAKSALGTEAPPELAVQ